MATLLLFFFTFFCVFLLFFVFPGLLSTSHVTFSPGPSEKNKTAKLVALRFLMLLKSYATQTEPGTNAPVVYTSKVMRIHFQLPYHHRRLPLSWRFSFLFGFKTQEEEEERRCSSSILCCCCCWGEEGWVCCCIPSPFSRDIGEIGSPLWSSSLELLPGLSPVLPSPFVV